MEENKALELRMYFFVPYNISPIQQAIQAGHAALEYAFIYRDKIEYFDFITKWKTWVILNGGTTNAKKDSEGIPLGMMDQIRHLLIDNSVDYSTFHEPDLNDALTALCFIADERVFNKKDYPDFLDYILNVKMQPKARAYMNAYNTILLKTKTNEELEILFSDYYEEWIEFIGGGKNLFLRELLKDKKLA